MAGKDIHAVAQDVIFAIHRSPTGGDEGVTTSQAATKEAVAARIRDALNTTTDAAVQFRVTGEGQNFHVYWGNQK